MATLTVKTTTQDGYIDDTAAVKTVISGALVGIYASSMTGESSPTIGSYGRGFWFFPAPSLPAGANVTRLRFWYNVSAVFDGEDSEFWVYVSNRADLGTTLTTADYAVLPGAEDGVNIFRVSGSAGLSGGAVVPPSAGWYAIELPVLALNKTGTTNVQMLFYVLSEAGAASTYLEILDRETSLDDAAYLEIDYEIQLRKPTPISGIHYADATRQQKRTFVPAIAPVLRPRSWLPNTIDAWQSRDPPQQRRPFVPITNPVPAVRRWMSGVLDAWNQTTPPWQARRLAPPAGSLLNPRAWARSIAEWYRADPALPTVRRNPVPDLLAPLFEPLFRPRAWLGIVAEWWRAVDALIRRQTRFPQPGTEEPPIEPPEEPDVCFPPVPGPVTAFTRDAAPVTAFTRGTVPGAFTRESVAALGATRYGYTGAAFDRMEDPDCVRSDTAPPPVQPGMGYGDGYGFNYGGG